MEKDDLLSLVFIFSNKQFGDGLILFANINFIDKKKIPYNYNR